jgi:hypothetical protein
VLDPLENYSATHGVDNGVDNVAGQASGGTRQRSMTEAGVVSPRWWWWPSSGCRANAAQVGDPYRDSWLAGWGRVPAGLCHARPGLLRRWKLRCVSYASRAGTTTVALPPGPKTLTPYLLKHNDHLRLKMTR